jgi:hypothetical protein
VPKWHKNACRQLFELTLVNYLWLISC